MFVFILGVCILCMVSIVDALGDSRLRNPSHRFWKWFYDMEDKLFIASYAVVASGLVLMAVDGLLKFFH